MMEPVLEFAALECAQSIEAVGLAFRRTREEQSPKWVIG